MPPFNQTCNIFRNDTITTDHITIYLGWLWGDSWAVKRENREKNIKFLSRKTLYRSLFFAAAAQLLGGRRWFFFTFSSARVLCKCSWTRWFFKLYVDFSFSFSFQFFGDDEIFFFEFFLLSACSRKSRRRMTEFLLVDEIFGSLSFSRRVRRKNFRSPKRYFISKTRSWCEIQFRSYVETRHHVLSLWEILKRNWISNSSQISNLFDRHFVSHVNCEIWSFSSSSHVLNQTEKKEKKFKISTFFFQLTKFNCR